MPITKRKIIRFLSYLLLALIIALLAYTLLFYHEIKIGLEYEIQRFGPMGLLIAGFIVDSIGGPLGPEVPVIGGLLAGIKIPTVIYMTVIGSIIASLIVYSIGYLFGEYGALHFVNEEKYKHWRKIFHRHRRITMVLSALTPVPYVTVCVISGIFRVRLWEYAIFILGARMIRIAGAAYIVLLFQSVI